VSEQDGDCILQFVEESVTMEATLPTSVTQLDALVVGGGGGGAFSGGGAGAMFDTTQNDSSSGEETITVADSGSDGVTVEVLVGAGGAGDNPAIGGGGTNGSLSSIDPEGSSKITKYGGVGGLARGINDSWTKDSGGSDNISATNSGASTAGAVMVRADSNSDSRDNNHPSPDVVFGRAGGDVDINNGCAGETRGSDPGLFAVSGGGGGAGNIGRGGIGTSSCGFNSVSGGGTQTRNSGSYVIGTGGDGGGLDALAPTASTTYTGRTTNTGGGGGGRSFGNDDALNGSASSSWTKDGTGGDSGIVVLRYSVPSVVIDQSDSNVTFGETLDLSATLVGVGGSVAWSSDDAACTFDDASSSTPTLTPALNAGQSCDVTVSQTGGSQGDSQDTITVSVVKADQASLTVTNSGDVGLGGSVELAVSGGSGTGSVTFSESCADFSISGATLSTTAAVGTTCTVTATKASSTNYNAATATKDFTVGKASPVFDSYDSVSAQVGSADVVLDDPTVQVNGSFGVHCRVYRVDDCG
jgi:hypothetical protein